MNETAAENEDVIVEAVRARALDPMTRSDAHVQGALPPPATLEQIEIAEARLGFALHSLHRRLLLEIADGGFGPGAGVIGVHHSLDPHAMPLVELRAALCLPDDVVPVCDWGCGVWSGVGSRSGRVITVHEGGLTDIEERFASWLSRWSRGEQLADTMFDPGEERTFISPFTGQPMVVRGQGPARGLPYDPSRP